MNIIGVNGYKRSGKGATGEAVAALLDDQNVHLLGFADKLKIMAARALGFDRPEDELIALMDEAKESWDLFINTPAGTCWHDLSGREYLQHFGTQARRTFGEDFWVDMVLPQASGHPSRDNREVDNIRSLRRMYPGVDTLVFTDLRFENEARRIKALGGVIWEVVRPEVESDGHDSEQKLPGRLIDWQLTNHGDLSDLKAGVAEALQETVVL